MKGERRESHLVLERGSQRYEKGRKEERKTSEMIERRIGSDLEKKIKNRGTHAGTRESQTDSQVESEAIRLGKVACDAKLFHTKVWMDALWAHSANKSLGYCDCIRE